MIRKYQTSDADAVIRIWLEASAEAHAFIDYDYWEKNSSAMRSVYLPSARTFVYCNAGNGEAYGFIAMAGTTVAALFVSPTRQGAGIGKTLLDFVKTENRELDLYVYCLNRRALRFYRNNGFVVAGRNTDPNTGEDQFHMIYRNEGR